MRRDRFCLALSVFALLLQGCAFSTRYQKRGTEAEVEQPTTLDVFEGSLHHQLDLEARSVESFISPPFTVGIVEITDQGLLNPMQYQQVLRAVRRELDAAAEKGTLLVVFAHGWHHGCRTCDRDLACFRRVLNELSKDEQSPGGRKRKVIGIYLGWRGRALLGQADVLTLWNRKQVAEHIGRTAGREVLSDLHDEWLRRNKKGQPVFMVTVGHSLGGALVFAAVRGKMSGNVDDIMNKGRERSYRTVRAAGERSAAPEGRKAIRSRFGDLVVLVNPAIEARLYEDFDNDLRDLRHKDLTKAELRKRKFPIDKNLAYSDGQLPIMLVVASTADTANGYLFPIARWLSGINLLRNAEVFFHRAERAAMGRYEPHYTHELTYSGTPLPTAQEEEKQRAEDKLTEECPCTKTWEEARFDFAKTELELSRAPKACADAGADPEDDEKNQTKAPGDGTSTTAKMTLALVCHRACEDPKDPDCYGWDRHSPYLVITTNKTVLREHSDIFNPVFTGFLRKYLLEFEKRKAARPTVAY